MTHDFVGWTPPPGAVVDPPVHPETVVRVIYSDGSGSCLNRPARQFNWSSVGDGPRVVAYAVVQEYTPEPKVAREWWLNIRRGDQTVVLHLTREAAEKGRRNRFGTIVSGYEEPPIHVREVLPEPPLDLTKITTPFGLLDEATQASLKAHGGPYEFWNGIKWKAALTPDWAGDWAYRVAPSAAPAKPALREVVAWAVMNERGDAKHLFFDEVAARATLKARSGGTVVRLSGVMPC